MTGARPGADLRRMDRLFAAGSVAGLSDGELLRRFAGRADEAAFEALATRHGPMVLGVCRRILDDGHAADDAFQATFLVLVKRSGSLRDGGRLGPWLYGVARRVAMRARTRAARRQKAERSGVETIAAPEVDGDRAELFRVLDEEIGRLPERYRSPVVLCYFEGLTHEEAAQRLGCPLGTVRSRIARARDRLGDRLTRRGVVVPASLLVVGTPSLASAVTIPQALFDATSRAAMRVASGQAITAAGVSASAAALAGEVLHIMLIHKLKVSAVLLAVLGTTLGGVAAAVFRGGNSPLPIEPAKRVHAAPAEPAQAAAQPETQGDLKSQLDAAVKAVLAVPVDPNEPRNAQPASQPAKIYALIQLGTIQAATKDVDAARATLGQAYKAAEAIPKNPYRVGTLARLAKAQAAIGDAEGARASLRMAMEGVEKLPDDLLKRDGMAAIVSAQFKLGDKEAVRATLNRILASFTNQKGEWNAMMLPHVQLIWPTARAGLFDEALALVDNPPFPIPLLRLSGRFEDLDPKTVEAIRQESVAMYQLAGLKAIAEAIVPEHGEAARKVLQTLNDRCDKRKANRDDVRQEIAQAQARVGDIDGALKTIERFPDRSDGPAIVLPYIAEAQLDAGRREAAVATLKRAYEFARNLKDDRFRPMRLQTVARGQMRAGDFAGAIRSAETMGPHHAADQVSYLMQIAWHQENAGDAAGAAQTRAKARAVAEARRKQPLENPIPGNPIGPSGLGNPNEDQEAKALREDYGRDQLARIAASLGEFDEAHRLAEQIQNVRLKRLTQATVTGILASSGDIAGAIKAAGRLQSPQESLMALNIIAAALADRAGATDASVRSIRP